MSILGNNVANIYTQGKFIKVYPIMERREAGYSLIDFTDNVGVYETLLTDGSGEFTGWNTEFVKHAKRIQTKLQNSEQGRHNQNHAAEHEIGSLANHSRRRTTKKVILKQLWYFGIV